MKSDIWVEFYIKITNFMRNCKRIFLSKYLYSNTWRTLVRFGKQTHHYKAKTLTFPE